MSASVVTLRYNLTLFKCSRVQLIGEAGSNLSMRTKLFSCCGCGAQVSLTLILALHNFKKSRITFRYVERNTVRVSIHIFQIEASASTHKLVKTLMKMLLLKV
eukprot:2691208-Ditylum_brightwellii.AAC.1